MKYLHKFTSMADFQAAYDGQDYIEPWVSLTLSGVPTKVSCSDEYETVYTLEYQGQALVGGETNCHIWYDSSNEACFATDTRTIEEGTEISYLTVSDGEYDWNDGGFDATSVEVLESEGTNYVHYNKKSTYDFIVTLDGQDQVSVVDNVGFMTNRSKFIDISKTYRVHVIQTGENWSDGEYDGTMTGQDIGDGVYIWSVTPDDSEKTSVSCEWSDYDPNDQHAYFYIGM